jgi:glyoxylase-like metal-dependent hydrolase (beta-lactamase superfamily II)
MPKWQYTKGLHNLGNGHYAYLVPDGSWGWSNAGLIEDGGQTLLVDTLFDLKSTREMLDSMRRAVPAATSIGALVNTHANGDHTFGNQLLEGQRIISSKACAEDMHHRPPAQYAKWQKEWQNMGVAGKFWYEVMGSRFDFQDIRLVLPTETFSGELQLKVGDKDVRLIEVGPAHTRGDVIVYVPKDKVLYTGDMLFNAAHPAIWAGPVSNWINACNLMLSWDLEAVVPGHGAMTDKSGIREFRDYLAYVLAESRKCYDRGMSFVQAAEAISLDPWTHFAEDERMYINTYAAYREFRGGPDPAERPDIMGMLELMGKRHFGKQGAH